MNFLRRLLRRRTAVEQIPPSAEILLQLDEPFRSALLSLYRGDRQIDHDGQLREINPVAGVIPSNGMWLYHEHRRRAPHASVETGMAYGFSTLFFLAAIAKNGSGNHTAIDAFEQSHYGGIGVEKVRQVGASGRFRFIQDSSAGAAAVLAREHSAFDFIFIDGDHRFDGVLLDFTVLAPLLSKGGIIIFDDLSMPSVRTAVDFVRTNRGDFRETPATPTFAAFERVGDDARPWDHFAPFTR
jgi:predicted O-methyltransferase YrrM